MDGLITSFRRSVHEQSPNHMVIKINGIDTKEKALKLVGKKVIWTSPAGKELKGEIKAAHGGRGGVRAIFETGMPGQSVYTKVKIE